MIPRILEYEDGRIKVTAEAFMLPELKAILDKFENDAEPYLAYIHLMTHPESPYANMDENEKHETIVYDVINTIGDFEPDEPLIRAGIEKLQKLFETRPKRYYEAIGLIMDKVVVWSKTMEVSDENLSDINRMMKEVGVNIRGFKDAEKQIDEELKTKMRGKSQLGDY